MVPRGLQFINMSLPIKTLAIQISVAVETSFNSRDGCERLALQFLCGDRLKRPRHDAPLNHRRETEPGGPFVFGVIYTVTGTHASEIHLTACAHPCSSNS